VLILPIAAWACTPSRRGLALRHHDANEHINKMATRALHAIATGMIQM
jgi:hypothetical protein